MSKSITQMSVSDVESRQQDEIESLRSIYGDIMQETTPQTSVWNKSPSPRFTIHLTSHVNPECPIVSLDLEVQFTPTYPILPAIVKVGKWQNLENSRKASIEAKVRDIMKEYAGEEICFTLIMEIKEMLDDFQQTTKETQSLGVEREQRLKAERLLMEKQEQEQMRQEALERREQTRLTNEQILRMRMAEGADFQADESRGYSFNQDLASELTSEEFGAGASRDDLLSINGTESLGGFVFANQIPDSVPGTSIQFRFRAVVGLTKIKSGDLLSVFGHQYRVSPQVTPEVHAKLDDHNVSIEYAMHVIELDDPKLQNNDGKAEIRSLELDLDAAVRYTSDSLLRVYGYQIDSVGPSWTVRILTAPMLGTTTLHDILATKGQEIPWTIARSLLIQILPALESMHDHGLAHQLLCPQTILVKNDESSSQSSGLQPLPSLITSPVKIAHPSYGARLARLTLLNLKKFLPWPDPDLSGGPMKTDIWDLGSLLARITLGPSIYRTSPSEFLRTFQSSDFLGIEDYAERLGDILSRMLQEHAFKRASLMELGAVKFLRLGMDPTHFQNEKIGSSKESISSPSQHAPRGVSTRPALNTPIPTNSARAPTSILNSAYRAHGASQALRNHSGFKTELLLLPSRYQREFEEVGKLGKGGFGEVVKARNRMEGTFYAIKKIRHRAEKLDSLLSEVLSLARLNHQYIVRYYSCWVEDAIDDDYDQSDEDELSDELELPLNIRLSSVLRSHDNSFQFDYFNTMDPSFDLKDPDFDEVDKDDDFDDPFEFARSDDDEEDKTDEESYDQSTEDPSEDLTSEVETSSEAANAQDAIKNSNGARSILYIQMEFCENNTLLNLIEKSLFDNPSEYWRLFRQLLEAVSYIHVSGFIHRDLKPMNIFIDRQNNVKVGDFGLAKNSQFNSAVSTNNQVATSRNKDLSTVVGTFFYTANEVATGDYDEKVDMYSLGVIFFEMCYHLSTGMERAHILNGLRLADVVFPSDFSQKKTTERRIIRSLLSHDPKKRPSATELLQSGQIPVEHQDEIIKEALRSLADPASPWQQQVRDTLFSQPYLLARDLMFDNMGRPIESDNSQDDLLILSQILAKVTEICTHHGAIRDFNGSALIPRPQSQVNEQIYSLLDRSGMVLSLSYDLVLPMARFLSQNKIQVDKTFRHEFVYRPNLRGAGRPDKYSVVAFDVHSANMRNTAFSDAECILVADEILSKFPCFGTKSAQSLIVLNHSDVLHSVLEFAFAKSHTVHKNRLFELIGVLLQLGVERGAEYVKTCLRNDFAIQHTVVNELVDVFNFTMEPERARTKLRKIMVDLPLLLKVERAFQHIQATIDILKKFDIRVPIFFGPLSSYNAKYYEGGIMFQGIIRLDKNRKFARVVSGGRYDKLINSLSNDGIAKSKTPHAVGLQLNVRLIYLLTKSSKASVLSDEWKRQRCDVLVTSLQESTMVDSGAGLLSTLWGCNVSADCFVSPSHEEIVTKAVEDGVTYIVHLKQPNSQNDKRTRKNTFKPIRVKNLVTGKDTDLDYDEIVNFIIGDKEEQHSEDSEADSKEEIGGPIFNIDVNQRVVIAQNIAPRGRKNKKDKWELENDSKLAGASVMKSLATAPVFPVELNDATLDLLSGLSISVSQEEWVKKIFFSSNKAPKNYVVNLQDQLNREAHRGTEWAILHLTKTDKTVIVDLQR